MSAPVANPLPSPELADQRDALERVLRSGFFDRAPNLALMLRYVCEQTFAGRMAEIKEYNIAVEALGRTSDFDQKKDAIVRVEAHRLRKRLAEYYEKVGSADPVEITLPPGTYAPRFAFRNTLVEEVLPPEAPPKNEPVAAETEVTALLPASSPFHPRLVPLLGLIGVLGLAVFWLAQRDRNGQVAPSSAPASSAIAAPVPADTVRILAGLQEPSFADREGIIWSADRYFEGGEVKTSPPRAISRTLTPEIYLTRREGNFDYNIPLRPGSYELRLHFAETVFGEGNIAGGGESSRVMSVRVNGAALPIEDIVAEAGGPNIAHVRVFKNVSPGEDGFLRLNFGRVKETAFVNAIEVVPSASGRMLPVRIAARGSAVVDAGGQRWSADRFFAGGQLVSRQEAVSGADSQELFLGERYGNFSYSLPVAHGGLYTLTLHFTENWFGQGRPGGGGNGSRLFDVYCNGRTLLKNFDVFKTGGGALRAVKKTFRGLEPNAQGYLHLMFVPVRNYAMVNAIEIVDESQ